MATLLTLVGGPAISQPALADFLFQDPATLYGGETVSLEPFVGYLRGTSGEYVYNPANPKQKISQLDWSIEALAVGGRIALRPVDWITIRGRFWGTVASGGEMTDYDWLAGYRGQNSWTHRSNHPDTNLGKAWQADGSVAFAYYSSDDLALTAVAGYRHYDVKYNAYGGSYIYSVNRFRDTFGTFTAGQKGIGYEQTWKTPYFGLGATYNGDDLTVTTEVIGSPFVMTRAKDFHVLRATLFRDDLDMTGMVGLSVGAEYRFSQMLSLVGRLDYSTSSKRGAARRSPTAGPVPSLTSRSRRPAPTPTRCSCRSA